MYEIICGSRSYDLQTQRSDTDFVTVSKEFYPKEYVGNVHRLHLSPKRFIELTTLECRQWYAPQILYPHSCIEGEDVYKFICDKREDYIYTNRSRILQIYYNRAKNWQRHIEVWYPSQPKRVAYSTLFFDTLYRYAKGEAFSQAILAGDMKETLLAIRNNELPISDVILLNQGAEKRFENVRDFYDSKVDYEAMKTFGDELMVLLVEEDNKT